MNSNFVKKMPRAFMLILAFILVFSFVLTLNTGNVFAAETATPISNLRVGHITDVHYFPLEHCYQEPFADDYRQSDFYHSISGDTKLVLESGTLLNATVKSVISDAKSGIAPDVIVVSGDLTKNGERVSHVDVANAFRYMQNEVRKVNGYSNFQVFVVPGNHDIYNSEAALYLRSNGKEYKTSSVNMTQFALIYAGLGYPNANLTGADGAINLLNYFEEDYWSSIVKDATGKITSPGFTGGYVASKNATNFDITYISDGLNYITPNHIEIGNDNNALSYAVSFKDNFAGYTLFAIDTTDREETTDIVPIRICKKAFIEFFSTPEKYNSHSFYLDTIKGKSSTEFTKLTVTYEEMLQKFDDGEYIYFGTKIDHITGGRITESCLNWMENYVATQNGDSSFAEETIIGTFHHNALPHFEQEDDLVKDFTLYNWEYTTKQLLNLGMRYAFTGHMHSNDTTSYMDAEGRTFIDSETGSLVGYDSPRRYVSISRNLLGGALAEDYSSQIFVQGKLPIIKSINITSPENWDEAGWSANTTFDTQLAANPDYFFATLMHAHLGEYYNKYVSGEVYGQLANRLLDHFLNDKLIGTLTGAVKNLLVGENSVLNNIGGGNLFGPNEQQLLNEMAQYMIAVIVGNDENIGGLYGKGNGYPYEGKTYPNIIEYLRGVIDNTIGRRDTSSTVIEGLQYGSEELNKISLGDLLVNTYVSHIMGRDLFSDINTPNNSLSQPQPELNITNTADDPHYRLRLQAAIKDLLAQCESGKFAKDLIGAVLDPLYNNENSLLKTLLQYPFDFTKANLTDQQKLQLNNIVKLLKPLLKTLTGAEVDIQIDMKHFVLGDLLSSLLPVLGGVLSDALGINLTSNDPIAIVDGFLDSYLVDSLYVGLGGIVGNIVTSLAVDNTPDFADIANTTTKLLVKPYKEYANHTYISNVKPADSYNLPTQSNGRLPSRVTANFDNKDSATSFTIKFYTAEDVFGTFRFKANANDEWTEIATTHYTNNSLVETLVDKFYSASSTVTTKNGVKATIKTEAIPQYVPLMDIGLLAATHSAVDYKIFDNPGDKDSYIDELYGGLDRDNAPKNSVLYYNCHTVTITGLKAGAEYLYDIGGNYTLSSDKTPEIADDNLLKFSLAESCSVNNFTFKTALPGTAETFDFLAIADIQGMVEGMYDNSFKAMDTLMKDSKTNGYDFILNAGDMTDNGKNFTQWGYALDTYLPTFANTSTFLAPGNHEKGSNALSTFYNYTTPTDMSMNRGEDGYYYSFNYGNAHFTVLDTNDADKNGLSQQQMNWLYQDLTANVNCKWKFVLMHKSMFSLGAHSLDSEVVAMRDTLPSLFQAYGVNMVFGGHDHTYTTTKLIDANGVAVDAPADENGVLYKNAGVLYITLGTMGTKFYEYVENPVVKPNVDTDNSVSKTLDSQTFGYISVDGETLTYKGYKLDNATQQLTEISNIVLSTDKAIAVNAVIAANVATPEKYVVKFASNQIDEIIFETSKISCDYTVTYISNGKEYEKINQIKLKNKNTAIDIALKDNLGNVSVVKSIIVEKDNYALIISLLVVGLAVVLAGAITIPVVLKVKKTKRKKA